MYNEHLKFKISFSTEFLPLPGLLKEITNY